MDCCSRGPGGRPDQVDWRVTGFAFLFPAIGGLLFGWDIGTTSGALTSIMDPNTSGVDWYALDSFQQGMVVSTSLAGALLASAAAAVKVGDEFGSKKELQLAFYVGAIVQGSRRRRCAHLEDAYGLESVSLARRIDVHRGDRAAVIRGLFISLRGPSSEASSSDTWACMSSSARTKGGDLLSTPAVPAAVPMLGMSLARLSALASAARSPSQRQGSTRAGTRQEGHREVVDAEMARMVSSDHHVGDQRAVQARTRGPCTSASPSCSSSR